MPQKTPVVEDDKTIQGLVSYKLRNSGFEVLVADNFKFKLIVYAVIENFGCRQMTVVWRIKGFWDYFRGAKSWGQMQRTGFAEVPK
jgi:hypothetical protein